MPAWRRRCCTRGGPGELAVQDGGISDGLEVEPLALDVPEESLDPCLVGRGMGPAVMLSDVHRDHERADVAPRDASPLATVSEGFDPIAAMFAERHYFARLRAEIIESNLELRERELIKLHTLAGESGTALVARGVPRGAAVLAAQAGATVFHVAFANWVATDHPPALRTLMSEALAELRAVTSG
jgi:hypothetical protein